MIQASGASSKHQMFWLIWRLVEVLEPERLTAELFMRVRLLRGTPGSCMLGGKVLVLL